LRSELIRLKTVGWMLNKFKEHAKENGVEIATGMSYLGFITGLRTRAGRWVRVGQVQVRVIPRAPAENPHPQGGFGGFLYSNKVNNKTY